MFQAEDKRLFHFDLNMFAKEETPPDKRRRKDTYALNTGPVLVSHNRALDSLAQVGSRLDREQSGGKVCSVSHSHGEEIRRVG